MMPSCAAGRFDATFFRSPRVERPAALSLSPAPAPRLSSSPPRARAALAHISQMGDALRSSQQEAPPLHETTATGGGGRHDDRAAPGCATTPATGCAGLLDALVVTFGDGPTVGRLALDQQAGVRLPVPEQANVRGSIARRLGVSDSEPPRRCEAGSFVLGVKRYRRRCETRECVPRFVGWPRYQADDRKLPTTTSTALRSRLRPEVVGSPATSEQNAGWWRRYGALDVPLVPKRRVVDCREIGPVAGRKPDTHVELSSGSQPDRGSTPLTSTASARSLPDGGELWPVGETGRCGPARRADDDAMGSHESQPEAPVPRRGRDSWSAGRPGDTGASFATVAQTAEQPIRNRQVPGATPGRGSEGGGMVGGEIPSRFGGVPARQRPARVPRALRGSAGLMKHRRPHALLPPAECLSGNGRLGSIAPIAAPLGGFHLQEVSLG